MSKQIEPMTDTQIKTLLQPPHVLSLQTKQLILRWIHAEARARSTKAWLEWFMRDKQGPSPSLMDDTLAAVKREVGWPEDK